MMAMEWFDYVLTAVISAIFGALFGGLGGYFLEIWKSHKREEKSRVDRIREPLRKIGYQLQELKVTYGMSDQYNYLRFFPALEQLDQNIEAILKLGLSYDIAQESKSLIGNLGELHKKFLEAGAVYYFKRSQIKFDDVDSLNRLFDEYRMQLFRDEQIKNLVYSLVDELVEWLKKHA